MQLEGKIALITGGGQGIGQGIVDRFLEEGAQVAIVQRRPLDSELEKHPRILGIQADVSDSSAISGVVERVALQLGGIDILVNNAGFMFERSVPEIRPEEWDRMMAMNMRAPLFLAQAALPHMRQCGGGSISPVILCHHHHGPAKAPLTPPGSVTTTTLGSVTDVLRQNCHRCPAR